MKALAALVLAGTLAAAPAPGHMITVEMHPSDDPTRTVGCAVILDGDFIRLAETAGLIARPMPPLRWIATPEEEAAILRALAAFVTGEIPGIAPLGSRTPSPPYVTVNWTARTTGGLQSGYWHRPGLDLPPALDDLMRHILSGGPCGR